MDDEIINLDGTQKHKSGATEDMGTGGTVTQNPENTIIKYQRATATTGPKSAGTVTSTKAQHMPPVYQATQYGVTLPETMGTVATKMRNITLETKRKIQETSSIN